VEGCREETRRVRCGRNESGNLDRTAKRRFDAGEDDSSCIVSQKAFESCAEEEWIAAKVAITVSSKGIMCKVEK